MPNIDCFKCWCNFTSKIYLTINISTLVLLFFVQNNKFYEDECFLQKIYFSELDPISDIYYSRYETDDCIQLGYLEKYSGKYTDISPKGIYKFDNNYVNVERKKSRKEKSNEPIKIDVKVSYKYKFDYIYKRNTNICFSRDCLARNGYCEIPFIKTSEMSRDTTNNFINDNNIKISSTNSPEFYNPGMLYQYLIYREGNFTQKEGQKDYIDKYKKIMLCILIINPVLRLVKIFMLSYITVKDSGNCTLINLFFSIFHAINAALFLAITIYYHKLPDEDGTYDTIQIILVVLEFICLIFGIITNYKDFSDKPNCNCYCDWCDKDPEEQKIKEKKEEKEKISEEIENIKKENKNYKLEMDKNKENLETILYEIKRLNAEKEEINYKLYLNREHKKEYETYKNLPSELTKMENILQKRLQELQRLKEIYDKNKSEVNKFSYNEKNKLNINCIYFDRQINAADSISSEYEFFKFLKNIINGVFFGIKEKSDLRFVKVQLPQNIKFILIFHGNDDDLAFLETYHSYFSHIIIFNNDKDEIINLKKFNNIYAIESDYKNIFLRLKEINIEFNEKNIRKYKPRNLYLLDDYIENDNIRKCQVEILKNTFLNKDLTNINNISPQGLTKNEFDNFINFINNNLKEIRDIEKNEKIDIDDFSDEEEDKNDNTNNNDNIYNNNINNEDNKDIEIHVHNSNNKNKMNKVSIKFKDGMPSEEFDLKNSDNTKMSLKNRLYFEIKSKHNFSIRLNNEPEIPNRTINTKKLGNIEKTPKKLIKEFLAQDSNYKIPEQLINLYTKEDEKFDFYINRWLFSLNYNIYKEISPIVGKMVNKIYELIIKKNNKLLNKVKLYRGFGIKKADIFLYKACEGDVFFYPSFTSTSISKKIVKNTFIKKDPSFNYKDLSQICNCLITINYNLKNDDVQQEAGIKEFSNFFNEEERLFPPFSFFRIKKVKYNIRDENNINGKIYDGTKLNPFKIKLEIINRNFYLDSAIIKREKFNYDRTNNVWKLLV